MSGKSTSSVKDPLWKLEAFVPPGAVDDFEDALSTCAVAVSRFEDAGGDTDNWRVEALFDVAPNPCRFDDLLQNLTRELRFDSTPVVVTEVPDQDWVGQSLEGLAPVRAGRYFIGGRHNAAAAPAHAISVLIEAGQAFGTGHHETTHGCLLALVRIGRLVGRPRRILDLGCGTGVLAIAAAKTWQRPVVASDIDPIATRITQENARANSVEELVHSVTAIGLEHEDIRCRGPYDVILANILAGPLRSLAPSIARQTAPRGFVVLSGLLASQERAVVSAFRNQGLRYLKRQVLNNWVTLVLRDRRRFRVS